MKWLKDADRVVSVSALIVAAASIIITVWLGLETRNHNRLSVRPRIDIGRSYDGYKEKVSIGFINNGMGPAVIEMVKVKLNGKLYDISEEKNFYRWLDSLGYKGAFNNGDISCGTIVPVGEFVRILETEFKYLLQNNINPGTFLKNVELEVRYKSLYEEEFTAYRK